MKNKIIQSLKSALADHRAVDGKADELIQLFEKSQDSILFFKKDKEMRIKYPDIWKMQLTAAEKEYAKIKSYLIEYGIRNQVNIEAIYKADEDSIQGLEDQIKSSERRC